MEARKLAGTARAFVDPPLRWAGGKRWLVDTLCPEIEALKPAVYVEPFLGGGAIALNLEGAFSRVLIDNNPTLMDVWRCLKELPENLERALRRVEETYGDDELGYFRARARLNEMILVKRMIWIERAAHALYINARCFNGLWRTNRSGFYNVPFGKLENPKCLSGEAIHAISAKLSRAMLVWGDAIDTDWRDPHTRYIVIYADPPYDGTFEGYTADGFDWDAQVRLSNALENYAKAGATVFSTNADTERIRELYKWAKLEFVDEHHCVGATGERRGKRSCLLIRGGRHYT